MSIYSGPEIINSGLVFYYDMDNTEKSWKGKPTTNLVNPDVSTWTTKTAIISTLNMKSPVGDVVYSLTDNTTTNYLLVGQSVAVPNDSSSYTVSVYILKTYGATSARLGFNYSLTGGTAVNTTHRFNSDTGVATAGSVIDLDEWWRWSITIVNNSTGNTSINCSFYPATGTHNASDNVNGVGTAIISGMQLEQNSFATPFVNGTRSNTQAILDLTGSNTITANSLTYNTDGSFSFNGSNYLDCSINANVFNLNIWLYNDYIIPGNDSSIGGVLSSYQSIINFNRQTTQGVNLGGWTGSAANESVHIWSNSSTGSGFNGMTYIRDAVPIGWHNFQFNWNGSTYDIWIDGVKKTTYAHTSVGHAKLIPINAVRVGGDVAQNYYFVGKVTNVSISNVIKSDLEVKQNFEALRDRYGV